jgi:hypothetical protein
MLPTVGRLVAMLVALGAMGAAHGAPPELPTAATGGHPDCRLAKHRVLGRGGWGRPVLVAFHRDRGLAVWLTRKKGRRLRVRPIGKGGKPRAGHVLDLGQRAYLCDLGVTSTGYLLLYRTLASKVVFGGKRKDVMTLWLRRLTLAGKPSGAAVRLLTGRQQTTAYLQWRGGKTKLLIDEQVDARTTRRRWATVAPNGQVGSFQPRPSYYVSGLGPQWREDRFLFVNTLSVKRGKKRPFVFFRKAGQRQLGKRLELPIRARDFYREYYDRPSRSYGLEIDSPFERPAPRIGWNGKRYFVAGPIRLRRNRFEQRLWPILCEAR